MNYSIETLPTYRIAFARKVGPYGAANYKTMELIKQWAKAKGLFDSSSILLGIPRDNPAITPASDCRYDACIVLSDQDYELDSYIYEEDYEGGTYLIMNVEHTEEGVKQAWSQFPSILEESGYQMEERPIIERYQVKLVQKGYCELCVPVKSL